MTPEAEMVKAVGALWSAERTQAALGLTEAEMAACRSSGALLGVQTSDGTWFYPLSQFETHDGGIRVRPGLAAFFEMLRHADRWSVAMMAVSNADELGGISPVEWVRAGRNDETLLDYANVLRSEWLSN